MSNIQAFALKLPNAMTDLYYQGRGIHGHVFAGGGIDRAKQYPSHEEACFALVDLCNIDGSHLNADVVPVPVWAINLY